MKGMITHMLIRIGKSWIYNTDSIKCIGVYKDEAILHVELTNGKEDQIQMNNAAEAVTVLEELMNAVAVPPLPNHYVQPNSDTSLKPRENIDDEKEDFDDAK